MNKFFNRQAELDSLGRAFESAGSSLYILYGRRRLGKTTLLQRFAQGRSGVYHMADRSGERDALRLLARSMAVALDEPTLESSEFTDWYALFAAYDRLRPKRKSFLILDEFQYLCEMQPAMSSIIQKHWDEHWSGGNLMLVLCGSVISMMHRETLSRSSPLYGRRTAQWLLQPLRFREVMRFFDGLPPRRAVEMWALTSGVPRYAELCRGKRDFRHAFRELVLAKDGPLYAEPKFLLQDEVTVENVYWSLLHAIGSGANRVSEMAGRLGIPANQLTRYLTALQDLGLLRREVPVTERNPAKSKRGVYQVADSFLRLWFSCVAPFESLIEFGRSERAEELMEPRLKTHMGWAFERVCREYVEDRAEEFDVVRVGRYWDRKVEVDIVGVDADGEVLLAGECKWTARRMGMEPLRQLEERVRTLWPDRADSIRLLMFSGGGFSPALETEAQRRGGRLSLVGCRELVHA